MPTPGFAAHWATELGASPQSLKRLQGGINNRVFSCGSANKLWVIKGYTPRQPGQHDRMQAEVEFLQFAQRVAPCCTPALYQIDHERRCVVLEHLEGKAFPEGVQPSETSVVEAVEFFRKINSRHRLAKRCIHQNASEGFPSLRGHLRNVHERLERMNCSHLDPKFRRQVGTLLEQLHRELAETKHRTDRMIDQGMVDDEIDDGLRCISPSDFGFQNAIQTPQGVCFIDFEFAGWDDPAKAAQDFVLQPRVPVAKSPSPLLDAIPPEHRMIVDRRYEAMGPILQLKWVCIQLAILQPKRFKEILNVAPEQTTSSAIQIRLEKASNFLRQIRTSKDL